LTFGCWFRSIAARLHPEDRGSDAGANLRIEAAICATCWSVWVRAFLASGISAAHRRRTGQDFYRI
jgi:hypothetical protein